jgi:hypothetical protein
MNVYNTQLQHHLHAFPLGGAVNNNQALSKVLKASIHPSTSPATRLKSSAFCVLPRLPVYKA